ncbi:hypothetical protein PRIPAC_77787 [Pristionchus pacificus]|uniref:Uncharacterized protein n=1 Tax=Pristionchus pacificus TaxID=54126 RepID=A0A2A6CQG8_PRIPA|nr:hypothetical protein PRIPAC_77787 [Pristionchus pacificus]|eukprot:PDM80389.1 hypothetical protein PRIPAC_32968 [Pristionchus pacificus]
MQKLFHFFQGISLGAFGNVLYLITAIFPATDAFFVLFFIGRFRTAVKRLFCAKLVHKRSTQITSLTHA